MLMGFGKMGLALTAAEVIDLGEWTPTPARLPVSKDMDTIAARNHRVFIGLTSWFYCARPTHFQRQPPLNRLSHTDYISCKMVRQSTLFRDQGFSQDIATRDNLVTHIIAEDEHVRQRHVIELEMPASP
jgi:hypothetical protein